MDSVVRLVHDQGPHDPGGSQRRYGRYDRDDRTRGDFEAAGTRPFVYCRKGEAISLSYWEAPAELFDDPHEMVRWAQTALGAASATHKAKPTRAKRR